jgi:hypothetical protein
VLFLNRYVQNVTLFATTGEIAALSAAVELQHEAQLARIKAQGQKDIQKLREVAANTDLSLTKIKEVSLRGMELVIPQSSVSNHCVRATLGAITLSNSAEMDADGTPYQRVTMSIVGGGTEANPSAARWWSSTDREGELDLFTLTQLDLQCDLLQHINKVNVDLGVGDTNFTLSHSQYLLLMHLLAGNLAESSLLAYRSAPALPAITSVPAVAYAPAGSITAVADTSLVAAPATGVAESATNPTNGSAIHVKVSLSKVEAKLLMRQEGSGMDEETPFLDASMKGLTTDVQMLPDTMVVTLSLSKLTLKDRSCFEGHVSMRKEYKRILSFVESAEDAPSLKVKMTQDDAKRDISIELSRFKCLLSPGVFLLPAFLQLPPTPAVAPIAKHAFKAVVGEATGKPKAKITFKSVAREARRTQAVAQAPMEEKVLEMFVRARLVGGTMHLIKQTDVAESQHLLLQFTASADVHMLADGNLTATAAVSGVSLSQETMVMAEGGLFRRVPNRPHSLVLAPVDIHVTARNTILRSASFNSISSPPAPPPTALHVATLIGPVVVRLTSSGYDTLMRCVEQLGGAAQKGPKDSSEPTHSTLFDVVEAKGAPVVVPDDESAESRLLPSASKEGLESRSSGGEVPVGSVVVVPAQPYAPQFVHVKLEGVSVTLLIDYQYELPIARLDLERTDLKLHACSHQRDIILQSCVSSSFFNDKIATWEPVLEPWPFTMNVAQSVTSLVPNDVSRISISSKTALNVNITIGMMTSLIAATDLLTAKHSGDNTAKQEFFKYRLENHTSDELVCSAGPLDTLVGRFGKVRIIISIVTTFSTITINIVTTMTTTVTIPIIVIPSSVPASLSHLLPAGARGPADGSGHGDELESCLAGDRGGRDLRCGDGLQAPHQAKRSRAGVSRDRARGQGHRSALSDRHQERDQ